MASGRQAFERKLEGLHALRSAEPAAARDQLARALRDRNNYFVARAAAIVSDHAASELIPDLIDAFERFMVDGARSDPRCLAKAAIAKSLRDLGHRDPGIYLRGIAHVQLEPGWGGRADTAAALRGTCALALTDTNLGDLEILAYLADALADPESTVRANAAMAIEQLNRPEGALILRLKALIGDPDPTVHGQCFISYLSLAPRGAVTFVSRFLRSASEDVQLEAASALAQCRDPDAISILAEFWREQRLSREARRALLINLGASPMPEAAVFLLAIVERESIDLAASALTALATSRFRADFTARVLVVIKRRDSEQLTQTFDVEFGRFD